MPDPAAPPDRPSSRLTAEDFRKLFFAGPTSCLMVDERGMIADLNAQAERVFGYDPHELIGKPIEVLIPERFRDRHTAHIDGFMGAPAPRPMGIGLELFALRRDGSELPVEIALSPVETSLGSFVLVSINDITRRRRLRTFGTGLLQGAEEERQRIARELHDDTAQALSALVLRLQMARRMDEGERREALLREMHTEIRRTSDGVRRILRGLRPPALEEAGLTAAIRAQAREALDDAGIRAKVEAGTVDRVLSEDGNLALYRMIQEAMANVARHAGATSTTISLDVEDGVLTAVVKDNGRGFAVENDHGNPGNRGLGIIGMQERATILGGSMRLESEAGKGTTVTIELPVSETAHEGDAKP